jgi:hypothetical protein
MVAAASTTPATIHRVGRGWLVVAPVPAGKEGMLLAGSMKSS